MTTLRFILGDQLSESISSLRDCNRETDILLMAEVWQEATYVKHHKKKIAFILSAMRHFAQALEKQGYRIDYYKLNRSKPVQSFTQALALALEKYKLKKVIITHPGEYRVLKEIQSWTERFQINLEIRQDTRFLCTIEDFKQWAKNKKNLRMEYFYRAMRRQHKVLMEDKQPQGGQWNFDKENRKPLSKEITPPAPPRFRLDAITKEVIALTNECFPSHIGSLSDFNFAVTHSQAKQALDNFIAHRLAQFGDYQDAMRQEDPYLFHSLLSFYLNIGLLLPKECIDAAQHAFKQKKLPINAVEGFIRQIIGWREFIRGIYWHKMPSYTHSNYLRAQRKLPDFYWDGQTSLNCLHQCIKETKANAYAHHIQRLMVLGNFALLIGASPIAVQKWYLSVYGDAFEWVEMPNVLGMILFADGGLLASKPYAASGAYINKMSNYCKKCEFKVHKKEGKDACPFNYLYWNFIIENKDRLAKNQRMALIYKRLRDMPTEKKRQIQQDAANFFQNHLKDNL